MRLSWIRNCIKKALDVFEDDPATSLSCSSHHLHKIACYSTS
ncbi:hypothetical protein BRADI_2g31693v3 [Brachypodium distachyon]|uniref:Uncharacterized protein n=1 Tax=Brachypodium distachyon TaxID=15368 RepID=A0A0Q3G6F7_BRADI|nr:hypothetical protein BRADI_2g31693v3 [Brachypodium distachyon]